jgi:hypothetical protein
MFLKIKLQTRSICWAAERGLKTRQDCLPALAKTSLGGRGDSRCPQTQRWRARATTLFGCRKEKADFITRTNGKVWKNQDDEY